MVESESWHRGQSGTDGHGSVLECVTPYHCHLIVDERKGKHKCIE